MNGEYEELIQQMTLEEKVSLLAGADLCIRLPFRDWEFPKSNYRWPNGARGAWATSARPPIYFRWVLRLAPRESRLVEKGWGTLAEEVKAKGAHILLHDVNIHRTPLRGATSNVFRRPFPERQDGNCLYRHSEYGGPCIKHLSATIRNSRSSISAQAEAASA